jgi:hypothetical protein
MENNREHIRQFLQNLPKKYNQLAKGVDKEVEKEYAAFSDKTGKRNLREKEIHVLANALYYPTGDPVMKKRALVILAHTASLLAFKQIDAYYRRPDKDLKHWAALALNESKEFLETLVNEQKE